MNAVIYLRKSTDDKERQVLSLDSQREICLEIAKKHGLTVLEEIQESGSAKKAGKRPQFRKLLNKVHAGKVDAIIVWKANRLSRNATEGGEIIDLMNNKKLTIFAESGEYGRGDTILLHIELGFATKYSQDLSDDVKVGMDSKVGKGWRPGKAPLGYKNVGKVKGEKSLVIDPPMAVYVRRMFDLALMGKSIIDIWETITREGLRLPASQKRSSRPMGKSQAYRLLTNPFYFGYFMWRGELKKGSHKAIVTKQEFDRVQNNIAIRGKKLKINNDFWWQGLLKCGECGASITAESKNRKLKDGTYRWHSYARCTKKLGKCSQKYIPVETLDQQLRAFLNEVYLKPEKVDRIRQELKERNAREFEIAQNKRSTMSRKLNDLFERKKELYGMKTVGLIDEKKFQEEKNKIADEEATLQTEDISLNNWLADVEKVTDFASRVKDIFDSGDAEVKKDIMRICSDRLIVRDQKVWRNLKLTFEQINLIEEELNSNPSLLEREHAHNLGVPNRERQKVSG